MITPTPTRMFFIALFSPFLLAFLALAVLFAGVQGLGDACGPDGVLGAPLLGFGIVMRDCIIALDALTCALWRRVWLAAGRGLRKLRRAVACGFFLLACLVGCTHPAPVVYQARVPAALLTCQADPSAPQATTQAQVAQYIVDLWSAGQDCRDKLAAVKTAVTAAPPAKH